MLYHNPQAVVQVNGERSESFALLSPLIYVLTVEPLLCRLRDGTANQTLHGVLFAGCVSAYADDITVFMFRRSDMKVVKKVVKTYEEVAGAKINFDKSEDLRLGAWRGGVPLPGPFRWSDGLTHILRVWFGPSLQLERNWLEVLAKVEAQVDTWLRMCLSLKSRRRCVPCTSSPWSFTGCPYFSCLRFTGWC